MLISLPVPMCGAPVRVRQASRPSSILSSTGIMPPPRENGGTGSVTEP